jgi:dynein heavy chain 1
LKEITITSFLDGSFRNKLESALRFGNPILIQDCENYDPLLNPVLNREIRRTGGRVLMTLGDQDIDFSPSFTMFFTTRDSTVEFPPDICSRVTFVNFTVTRASLQAQCLHQVLKFERPDVEEKRLDLLKIQGEYQKQLRELEKSLLQALNDVKGKILDDDSITSKLENLKKEAADISDIVAKNDTIMKEVDTVIHQYLALAQSCSSIFFTMESLNQLHPMYQYALQYFLEIFNTILTNNVNLKDVKDSNKRLSIIANDLFYMTYYRVARGMLHYDRIVFALMITKIYLKGFKNEPLIENEFGQLISSSAAIISTGSSSLAQNLVENLTPEQTEAMLNLSQNQAFKNIKNEVKSNIKFVKWLDSDNPELDVPILWSDSTQLSETSKAMKRLLLIKAFRPDKWLNCLYQVYLGKNLYNNQRSQWI